MLEVLTEVAEQYAKPQPHLAAVAS